MRCKLCEFMRYYANQLNFMIASQGSAKQLFMRALRARMQKTMRRRLCVNQQLPAHVPGSTLKNCILYVVHAPGADRKTGFAAIFPQILFIKLSKVIKPFSKSSNHFQRHQSIFTRLTPVVLVHTFSHASHKNQKVASQTLARLAYLCVPSHDIA